MQTNQSDPNRLNSIQQGAAIAYVILGLVIFIFLENSFCNLNRGERVATILAMAAISAIFPWLYTKFVAHEYDQKVQQHDIKYSGNLSKQIDILAELEHNIASSKPSNPEIERTVGELKSQIISLNDLVTEDRVRRKAFEKLSSKRVQKALAEDAVRAILSEENLIEYAVLRQNRKRIRGLFCDNITQCIRWISYSLEGGVAAKVDKLKSKFILPDQIELYESTLRYIKDYGIPKKFPRDQEIFHKVGNYIEILIERLK
jgi:hypothetical protein